MRRSRFSTQIAFVGSIVVCPWALGQYDGCTSATEVSAVGAGPFHTFVAADDGFVVSLTPRTSKLHLYSVQDPENPTAESWAYVNGVFSKVLLDGQTVMVASTLSGSTGELFLFDITAHQWPWTASSRIQDPDGRGIISGELRGSFCYTTSDSLFRVYDISSRTSPNLIGEVAISYGSDIVAVGDLVFVLSAANGDPGLVVVDTSDPANPMILSRLALPGVFPLRLAISNGTAFVVVNFNQVLAIDISDPLDMQWVSTVVSPESIVDVAARYNALFVMEQNTGGLHIYDMVDPSQPRWIDSHDPPSAPNDVAVTQGLVVVADGFDGVRLFQLSDCSRCGPDLANPTGVLDFADVQAFLRLFAQRHRVVDLDVNAVWDIRDVLIFLEEFAEGCP
jgi:hypothetical protein